MDAIVLAAGLSSRMGAFKPLLALGGVSLVERVIAAVSGSGRVDRVVVVTGHRASEVAAGVPMGVDVVVNAEYAKGEMLSSVKVGLRKIIDFGGGRREAA